MNTRPIHRLTDHMTLGDRRKDKRFDLSVIKGDRATLSNWLYQFFLTPTFYMNYLGLKNNFPSTCFPITAMA